MKRTYNSLLSRMIEQYTSFLIAMNYWDKRSDAEPQNEINIKIRNEYAYKASGLCTILQGEITQDEMNEIREEAEQLGNAHYHGAGGR